VEFDHFKTQAGLPNFVLSAINILKNKKLREIVNIKFIPHPPNFFAIQYICWVCQRRINQQQTP
jgi:hypothetical protein